jgi:hypothetical protein
MVFSVRIHTHNTYLADKRLLPSSDAGVLGDAEDDDKLDKEVLEDL